MSILKCPPDFADHAPLKTNRQLAEKYGVGEKTITRWRKETGCTATIRPFASAALPKQHVPSISPGLASEAALPGLSLSLFTFLSTLPRLCLPLLAGMVGFPAALAGRGI